MKKEVKMEKVVRWEDICNKPPPPENVTCYGCGHLVEKTTAVEVLVCLSPLHTNKVTEKRYFGKSCKPDYVRVQYNEDYEIVFVYEELRGEDGV